MQSTGGWETDETAEEAAARESMEEAGVRGTCVYVGEFKFKSRKKALNASGLKGGCLARVFVMDVTEEMTEWPEQKKRTRRWMPIAARGAHGRVRGLAFSHRAERARSRGV